MVEAPKISVIICTRNRGNLVVSTLESVLQNTHTNFEVILVDQSTNVDTENYLKSYCSDTRFTYIHSDTCGVSRSRNIGLGLARSDIVAFTDDDCRVPSNWLEVIENIFMREPRIAIVFCNVLTKDYDRALGYIPEYIRQNEKTVRTFWDKCFARGIGAGMAVRKKIIFSLGGFDEMLGPGSLYRGCEDGDIAVRAIINKWLVYETSEVAVIHDGFRYWDEGKTLAQQNWVGIGAAYSKPIKCGHWGFAIVILYETLVEGLLYPLSKLCRFQKPKGIKNFWFFWIGFFRGIRQPMNYSKLLFR